MVNGVSRVVLHGSLLVTFDNLALMQGCNSRSEVLPYGHEEAEDAAKDPHAGSQIHRVVEISRYVIYKTCNVKMII